MSKVEEAAVEYKRTGTLSSGNRAFLMEWVREGLEYATFQKLTSKYPFTIEEWSKFLHISERTIQRYKKDFKNFDALQSEKILQISFLYQRGVEIFGAKENFDQWLELSNIALGNIRPKDLLDNAFGISLLEEELSRIEHGILA
jgi:putative toxin-antitoxin system antitoxin component (TIGR02293 family)